MVEAKRALAGARALSAQDWLRAAILAVALFSALAALIIHATAPSPAPAQSLVGTQAPDFTLPVATSAGDAGRTVSLAEQRGHPVLLVFFFTLCTHCQPQLQTAQAAVAPYADAGLRLYAVNAPAESADVLTGYRSRVGFQPDILLDEGARVAHAYGIQLYPTTVLIDANGMIRAVWTGETDAPTLDRALRQAPSS